MYAHGWKYNCEMTVKKSPENKDATIRITDMGRREGRTSPDVALMPALPLAQSAYRTASGLAVLASGADRRRTPKSIPWIVRSYPSEDQSAPHGLGKGAEHSFRALAGRNKVGDPCHLLLRSCSSAGRTRAGEEIGMRSKTKKINLQKQLICVEVLYFM